VEHKFELEFNYEDKKGFIDFIYYDKQKDGWVIVDFKTGKESKEKNNKYQEQLDFYKEVMQDIGYAVCETKILWI
jgi:ATP-dependent exoDNAse (exonuclease V) beta subunit